MGGRLRAFAWETTPLGPSGRWPQSLKTLVGVMLAAHPPMFVAWGPERLLIYNDGYAPMLADRHPSALGRPFFSVWPEVCDELTPLWNRVFAGEAVHMDDLQLFLDRPGRPKEAHFAFSYTPVRDEQGQVVGLFCACTETTEQVLAERKRLDAAERQGRLLQQMPGFVCVLTGPNHTYEYVNDAYVDISGPRAFIGRSVREVFPELAGQGFFELLDGVYATGEPFSARGLPIRLEGESDDRHIDFLYQPMRDESGAVTGIFVGGYDITERFRTEAQLRASEARLQAVIDAAPIGLVFADAHGRITGGNTRVEQIVGHPVLPSPDVDAYREWVSFYPDGRRVEGREYPLARVLAGEERSELEVLYRRGDGREAWVRFLAAAIRGQDGGTTGGVVASLDIDHERRTELRLRELNADLERQVIERTQARGRNWAVSPDLMGALNSEGYFETSNPAWEVVLGWSEDEVRRMPIWDLLHPDDIERTREGFALTQIGQPAIGLPNRYRCKDGGYRWISWVGVPEDGIVYCTGRDITVEKEQAAELAAAQEALRQSQKMEAVGQLTGGLAHDFNNLLTGITGSLEIMQTRIAQGRLNDIDRYMNAAQGAAKRAAALTQRLLAFSRRQTLDPRPVNVNRLIGDMEELIRRTIGPTVHLEVGGAGGLWPTLADPNQLENALLNLCINARAALPDGGRITIETANKWLDDRAAKERDLPPGQYLSLCVTDTGTGMAPEVVARAFDPFFTTKPLGVGTGLGLSMIYGFVRQTGGQVRIYTELGKGTTMCLYLPRYDGDAQDADALQVAIDSAHVQGGETVLVVDDEPTVRMLIAEVLGEIGFTVIEAEDGASGLKVLQAQGRIDLLITDVGLRGGMNGRQVADAARVVRPELKVLFITGYAENAAIGNGHLEKGMAVLTKPFAMESLGLKVKEVMA